MTTPTDQKTLRDEFAMAALTGLLAAVANESVKIKYLAESAYAFADAMLLARKRETEE